MFQYRWQKRCLIFALFTLCSLLSGCGSYVNAGISTKVAPTRISTPSTPPGTALVSALPGNDVAISNCQGQSPASVVTTNAPGGAQRTLYISASTHLYAVNASNGTARWCRQVKSTRKYGCPPGGHCPSPLFPLFGTPKVVNNVVYICISEDGTYTAAFNAESGSLLWSVQSDCEMVDIPFADYAVPLVRNNIIYSGTYALRAQDGKVLWRAAINVATDGPLSLQALVGNTIYANTGDYIYAIDAGNGRILWRSAPDPREPLSGPLVVSDQRLYVGTLNSVENPDAGNFYALDVEWCVRISGREDFRNISKVLAPFSAN
jgi:outer membrane protein assembly factor BamB